MIRIEADGSIKTIGYQKENERSIIELPLNDIMDMVAEYPNGVFTLAYKRSGDSDFYVSENFEIEEGMMLWTVENHALQVKGVVEVQIAYTSSPKISETRVFYFNVMYSIMDGDGEGKKLEDLVSEALVVMEEVKKDIEGYDEMTATAYESNTPQAEIDRTGDHPVLRLGLVKGERGADGPNGVYVGVNPPTDPNARVWLNPEGTGYDVIGEIENKLDKPLIAGLRGQVLTSDGNGGESWQNPGEGGIPSIPMTDMEWDDVYGEWQAGYYYDEDNDYAYTQIPADESTWGVSGTRTSVSCTPYSSMIPVQGGEEYRYRNMPVYFDSKSKVIPSVILFDSNKDAIVGYTRTYQDVYTEFTVPANAVWMAVIYANNQTYILQKHIVKMHDDEENLVNIMADYRSYSLCVPPVKKTLTKGYICIGTDDIRAWETKDLNAMFVANSIPYYMAAVPEAAKNCITNDPYKTNLDYMRTCVGNGGEIICHSGDWITEANKNDYDTMYKYFCKGKEELESYGFKIRGIFKAGGENAIYDTPDPVIDAWATHYFEFGDYFTSTFPYRNSRTLLDDWESYSSLATRIQNIVANHSYGIFAFHYYNENAQLAMDTIMNALSGYTRGVDYEFVTPSQLYDLLMPDPPPSGGGENTTYSLSMSGNVITLTGSDGSTTTATLPVYNGGLVT